ENHGLKTSQELKVKSLKLNNPFCLGLSTFNFRPSTVIRPSSDFLDHNLVVRENANLPGKQHGLLDDFFGGHFSVLGERAGGGQRKGPARTDGHNPIVGLDHVAVA